MTPEIALLIVICWAILWYYVRYRLIEFTQPERVRAFRLQKEIEALPEASSDDKEFARLLATRSLSPLLAWIFTIAHVVYVVKSCLFESYRRKLDEMVAEKPPELQRLLARLARSTMRSVYATAPFAWILFRFTAAVASFVIVLFGHSSFQSIERVRARIVVADERTMLQYRFSKGSDDGCGPAKAA